VLDAARCDWQRGVALRFLCRLNEAIDLLDDAATILRDAERDGELPRVERDLAIAYNLVERFGEADELIATARASLERASQPVDVALCDLVIGSQLRQRSRYREALAVLRGALLVFRSAGRGIEQAKTLFMMALTHLGRQAYEAALACLDEAQSLFSAADLPMRIAYCNLARGRALWRLGRFSEAEARMAHAEDWFTQADMRRNAADCSLNLGNVAFLKGDCAQAEARYREARQRYEELGIEAFVARCEQNLGLVRHRQGRFDAALDRLHRAVDRLDGQGIHIWAADCHRALADVYLELRQEGRALSHIDRARKAYGREGVRLGEAWCELWTARLANRRQEVALMRGALERARKAAAASGSARYLALCYRTMGDLLLEQDVVDEAEQRYRAARDHFATAGAPTDEAACLLGLGRVAARRGELERAASVLEAVLRITEAAFPDLTCQACTELGRIARRLGEERQAVRWYERALSALRRARLTLPEAQLAGGFAASHRQMYDEALRLALELEEDARALEIVEDSRSQVLVRTLAARPRLAAGDRYLRELLDRELELRARVQRLRRRLLGSLDSPTEPPGEAAGASETLLQQLRERRSEHRNVVQRILAAAGGWQEAVEPFRWEPFCRAAHGALPAGWSALIYHWLGEQLIILCADGDDLRVRVAKPSPVERAALEMATSSDPERRALLLGEGLHGRRVPSAVGSRYRRLLYDLLVPAEVTRGLSPDRLLLIVPHGPLHHLPFQVLENEGRFLAEQAIVGYAPGLGVLRMLLERRSLAHSERPGEDTALLLGIEAFKGAWAPLRWAPQEVARLSAIYGERATCLQNERATVAAIRSLNQRGQLREYGTLHLASHANLDATSGALSSIALWDQDLTLVEASRLHLGPAVVILSACRSGLGEINPGDEIVNPSVTFLAAGAQTVIASLWHVDDRSTSELMVALHRHLRAGESPAAALVRAQRGAISRGYRPYEWGAFVATGVP
jgi:tetratricopeptide (TPR) repeat protein